MLVRVEQLVVDGDLLDAEADEFALGDLHLELADVVGAEQDRGREVPRLDHVGVPDGDLRDTQGGEDRQRGRADATATDERDLVPESSGVEESRLVAEVGCEESHLLLPFGLECQGHYSGGLLAASGLADRHLTPNVFEELGAAGREELFVRFDVLPNGDFDSHPERAVGVEAGHAVAELVDDQGDHPRCSAAGVAVDGSHVGVAVVRVCTNVAVPLQAQLLTASLPESPVKREREGRAVDVCRSDARHLGGDEDIVGARQQEHVRTDHLDVPEAVDFDRAQFGVGHDLVPCRAGDVQRRRSYGIRCFRHGGFLPMLLG